LIDRQKTESVCPFLKYFGSQGNKLPYLSLSNLVLIFKID